MLIISHTMFRSRGLANTTMPTPDVIIVDEVHTPFAPSVHRFVQQYPDVFKLGMTATLPEEVHQPIADLFAIDRRLIPAFTFKIPAVAKGAVYPWAKLAIEYVSLTELERHSYNIVHQIGERAEQIRALLFPVTHEEGDDAAAGERRQRQTNKTYVNKIWKDIMGKLTRTNKKIHENLVNIMLRCNHRDMYWDAIMNMCGKQSYMKIQAAVDAQDIPDTHDSAPETQRRLDAVGQERKNLLGAYSYAAKVIVEASNVDQAPEIECSVCYDATVDYVMSANCGHFLCTLCSKMCHDCPICRTKAAWRAIDAVNNDFTTVPQPVQHQTLQQNEQMLAATSTKFARLAELIKSEKDGRMLIISPLVSLLPDIDNEMRKIGLNLVTLSGASAVLQGKLRRWRKGGSHGLLSGPEIPSLNLSEAKTLVFLSPLLADIELIQSCGRVIRQGSLHAEVTVIMLVANDTIESSTLIQRSDEFHDTIQKISKGQISTDLSTDY
jgi:superfamily II DNA or RNA helicase